MADTERKNAKSEWFSSESETVLEKLGSSPGGLSQSEAEKRLSETGPNSLEAKEGVSKTKLLLSQVNNPLIFLLFAAAGISLLTGHAVDAIVILGVIALNTVLGFIQESRSANALAALRQMTSPHARVLRDQAVQVIEAQKVVPGDLLLLETGDRVAADARLIGCDDLHADESALTGESEPAIKSPDAVKENAPLGDRRNMVWMSTNITAGRGRAVVVATGMNTEMGAIAGQVSRVEEEGTPLQKRIHSLSILLGALGIVLASAVVGLGLLRGYEAVEMLLFGVAVAVSAIPEGLPAVITVTLALGVSRMASKNALIRHLPTVETLGSTTVICTDKTGTLTENQMTVRKLWDGTSVYDVTGEGYQPDGEIRREGKTVSTLPEDLERLLRIGTIANNAHLDKKDNRWKLEGNPSEGALLSAAMKAGLDPNQSRNDNPRLHEIPFSSDRKFMAVLLDKPDGSGKIALVKGAPDRLLTYASKVLLNGQAVDNDKKSLQQVNAIIDGFAENALRILAGAFREFGPDKKHLDDEDVKQGLTLCGLWGIIDPPRSQSAPAVQAARRAGVHTVMITGDHAATALAIAKQVGIAGDDRVLGAKDIETMDAKQLAEAALHSRVFARVSPAHKLQIMQALKSKGHIVAMTGDGVNDAPALKGADIGIAMGRTGTEVAKEAADMILVDDNFATIVKAIEEGRVIFTNLRRVIFFLLATNLGEVLTLGGALIVGLELPLTAVMILWINLVTDGACTVPLGMEPRHEDVLNKPPRDPKEPIIYRPMLVRMSLLTPIMAIGTLLLFWYEIKSGSLDHARTVAFTTMAVFQWFQALNARSEYHSVFSVNPLSNRWLLVGVTAAVLLQIGAVHTPVGQWMFGTVDLTWFDWLLILAVGSTIWIADEIFKLLKLYGRPEQPHPKKSKS
jgi:P-type Ca2+ transporter type 2C